MSNLLDNIYIYINININGLRLIYIGIKWKSITIYQRRNNIGWSKIE